jgi:creatinine amidohydrolase/Fe(II)-dependent formamide hydrolase-like protein
VVAGSPEELKGELRGDAVHVELDAAAADGTVRAALARLPEDALVLGLPPTNFGKSVEHLEWPGTLTFSGDTLRAVMRDIASSVARSGFSKLVLFTSHGGNVGIVDDYFRDLRIETGLRVFKIHLPMIAPVPGLIPPEEAAVGMHCGEGETSLILHLAPELVQMDRAAGYVFDVNPDVGFSFKGQDAIEAWVSADLAENGAIGNPHGATADKGRQIVEAKVARLAQLLEAIYCEPKREIRLAPTPLKAGAGTQE